MFPPAATPRRKASPTCCWPGLAPDGGLFLPETWPQFAADEIAGFAGRPYAEVAHAILKPLVGASFSDAELRADIAAAYADFDDPAIAPLVEIGDGLYLLELFHGPTLAFKDMALQVLGRLFARALKRAGGARPWWPRPRATPARPRSPRWAACQNIDLFVLHPKGRVSEVQRLQMTTSPHANVHNIALEGTFDDAQAIVKALFADADFAARTSLTAVNSINFARIAAQCVYYFTAAAQLGTAPAFVVPTGNFGDVFAGEAAMRMGLAAEKLVVATNANDIMARALNEGVYAAGDARPTLSPSMDIQVASNFERALFEASGRDAEWIRGAMADFSRDRRLVLPPDILAALRAPLCGAWPWTTTRTLATIAAVHRDQRTADRSPHRRGAGRCRRSARAGHRTGGGAVHGPSGQIPRGGPAGNRSRAPLAPTAQGPL